jgi:hypothetical protein
MLVWNVFSTMAWANELYLGRDTIDLLQRSRMKSRVDTRYSRDVTDRDWLLYSVVGPHVLSTVRTYCIKSRLTWFLNPLQKSRQSCLPTFASSHANYYLILLAPQGLFEYAISSDSYKDFGNIPLSRWYHRNTRSRRITEDSLLLCRTCSIQHHQLEYCIII